MASYININGNNIPIRASDPTNPILGEIWYNTTTNSLKGQGYQTAAWATGGNMSGASGDGGMATAGSQTAFLAAMGSPGARSDTETYDGTSWSDGPSTPYSASGVISFGAPTAVVHAGGQPGAGGVSTTIEWNGSSWAGQGSTPYPILYQFGGAGPGADGISIGGWNQSHPTGGAKTDVKVYNGSTWSTDGATCPFPAYTGAHYGAGSSDVNYFGGYNPGAPNSRNDTHVNYNGTTFTTLAVYPTPIANTGNSGTTSDAYIWGGNINPSPTPYTNVGNSWNGTSWATSTSYPQSAQTVFSGGSTVPVAISSGGYTGSYQTTTFEYQAAGPVTKTISSS